MNSAFRRSHVHRWHSSRPPSASAPRSSSFSSGSTTLYGSPVPASQSSNGWCAAVIPVASPRTWTAATSYRTPAVRRYRSSSSSSARLSFPPDTATATRSPSRTIPNSRIALPTSRSR